MCFRWSSLHRNIKGWLGHLFRRCRSWGLRKYYYQTILSFHDAIIHTYMMALESVNENKHRWQFAVLVRKKIALEASKYVAVLIARATKPIFILYKAWCMFVNLHWVDRFFLYVAGETRALYAGLLILGYIQSKTDRNFVLQISTNICIYIDLSHFPALYKHLTQTPQIMVGYRATLWKPHSKRRQHKIRQMIKRFGGFSHLYIGILCQ